MSTCDVAFFQKQMCVDSSRSMYIHNCYVPPYLSGSSKPLAAASNERVPTRDTNFALVLTTYPVLIKHKLKEPTVFNEGEVTPFTFVCPTDFTVL